MSEILDVMSIREAVDGTPFSIRTSDFTFEEAVNYFGSKLVMTSSDFYDLKKKYRVLAFTVSGYTQVQVLNKFQGELYDAIEQGTTMEVFKNNMNSFLIDKGYEGITNFQADNIFRTNIQTAYNVGHYEIMTDATVMKLRPYWQYDAVNDSHTRPSHLAMDGKVFTSDSSVWDVWYPPNGYRCRCGIRTLSKRQVEQEGLKVETEIPKASELKDGTFVNILPDNNFDINHAKVKFTPDLEGYPETLKKAYSSILNSKNNS